MQSAFTTNQHLQLPLLSGLVFYLEAFSPSISPLEHTNLNPLKRTLVDHGAALAGYPSDTRITHFIIRSLPRHIVSISIPQTPATPRNFHHLTVVDILRRYGQVDGIPRSLGSNHMSKVVKLDWIWACISHGYLLSEHEYIVRGKLAYSKDEKLPFLLRYGSTGPFPHLDIADVSSARPEQVQNDTIPFETRLAGSSRRKSFTSDDGLEDSFLSFALSDNDLCPFLGDDDVKELEDSESRPDEDMPITPKSSPRSARYIRPILSPSSVCEEDVDHVELEEGEILEDEPLLPPIHYDALRIHPISPVWENRQVTLRIRGLAKEKLHRPKRRKIAVADKLTTKRRKAVQASKHTVFLKAPTLMERNVI